MKKIIFLIGVVSAQNLRKLVTSCEQTNVPSCARLLFSVNGYNQVHDCNILQKINKDFITGHTYFCSNMILEYIPTYCVNLTNMPDNCFKNVGDKINTLYTQHNKICSKINIIFNSTNTTIMDTIQATCNINWSGKWWESVPILFGLAVACIIGLCLVSCCLSCCCGLIGLDYERKRHTTTFRTIAINS